ncbi:hypothetical protein BGZ74_001657 [Mortierella antarctica]|nr:hypothetical protein BGZ74_001657 [Mortierella antarctica]
MTAIWLCCQINSVADAVDKDQGVVGAVYNVILQLGNPIGIAIGNIIANKKNTVSAFGSVLLPGYRAVFYAFAAMAVRPDVAQGKDEVAEGKIEIDSVSTLEKTL